MSSRLQELCGYYSNRISYQEVASLVERVAGERLLSDQKVWQIVKAKAEMLSQQIQQSVAATLAKAVSPSISVNPKIDLYDPQKQEILLFDDSIQVKEQSARRYSRSRADQDNNRKNTPKPSTSFVITDLMMLQKPTGTFEYIAAPINAVGKDRFGLAQVVQTKVMHLYGKEAHPLNLVAITDGAKSIRNRLLTIFGTAVTTILDWYHLCKKLRQLMSMIAINQTEKTIHLKFLHSQLWQGKVTTVIEYLKTQVTARNRDKLSELIGYLVKHSSEIINYDCRSKASKTIGSGRMEKGVDLVVGRRQKHKAMSWRPTGSKALALLKVAELNGQWQQLWFSPQAA